MKSSQIVIIYANVTLKFMDQKFILMSYKVETLIQSSGFEESYESYCQCGTEYDYVYERFSVFCLWWQGSCAFKLCWGNEQKGPCTRWFGTSACGTNLCVSRVLAATTKNCQLLVQQVIILQP